MEDFDSDGVIALIEYALGASDQDSGLGPNAPVSDVTELEIHGVTNTYFTLAFTRELAADDVQFAVESTYDLNTWNNAPDTPQHFQSITLGNAKVKEVYRSALPMGQHAREYMRLKLYRAE
jgi:hypothetical protein